MHNSDLLVKTKLRMPPQRRGLLVRPRLVARLGEGLQGPLTLIAAPAGFGKTSLAVTGIAASGMRAAWLSLDENDNEIGRFLRYLVAALQQADPILAQVTTGLLAGSQPTSPEVVLATLVNALEEASGDLALVLDDYQYITQPAIQRSLAFLLEQSPRSLHLVITTRSDPGLPLARLRARGLLVELRAADLRFTAGEAADFLNGTMGLGLSDELVAALAERTEGWVAGLQMASIRLAASTPARRSDHSDAARFVQHFSGSNRHILDYLLEEVLAHQTAQVQRFLLRTSILQRLCAPLCAALMQEEDVANAASTLDYLERSNLFLLPLDDERRWYRYHRLFADLLQAQLRQEQPEAAPNLHRAAAGWLEHEGYVAEAVDHLLAALDYDRAADLVEQHTTALLTRGELAALMGWIGRLPEEVRLQRPWLCVQQAYALAFAGRLSEAEPLLALAEKGARGADEKRALGGALAAVRAMLAVMAGHDAEAVVLAEQARALLPAERRWDRATATWALGYAQRTLGRLAEARSAFEEQIELARAMGNVWTLVTGLTDLALVLRTQGQLGKARTLFEEALQAALQEGARGLGYIARMEAGLAGILCEQNELEAARRLLEDAIAHTQRWPNPNHQAFAFMLLARTQWAIGDLAGAWLSIGEADRVRRSAPVTRVLSGLIDAMLVRLRIDRRSAPDDALARTADALVARWRQEFTAAEGDLDEAGELAALAVSRNAMAEGRPAEALSLLKPVVESARAAGRVGAAIEALLLTGLALHFLPAQHTAGALDAVEQALTLAEPGGYVRIFLEEGHPMHLLLAQWTARAGGSPLRPYAARLLAAFQAEPGIASVPQTCSDLVEPLSPRELEVLALMAQGFSNQEIAAQLIVAPGTVKAHTASIYRKLDVANRTQAVARARETRILS